MDATISYHVHFLSALAYVQLGLFLGSYHYGICARKSVVEARI
jgi:hypothetical protein